MTRDEYKAHVLRSADEDARRIVACVNACEGISTENLEENKPIIELARAYNASLRQRDDLLEALKSIEDYWNQDQNETAMADACWHAINTARAAIARATGEQP